MVKYLSNDSNGGWTHSYLHLLDGLEDLLAVRLQSWGGVEIPNLEEVFVGGEIGEVLGLGAFATWGFRTTLAPFSLLGLGLRRLGLGFELVLPIRLGAAIANMRLE